MKELTLLALLAVVACKESSSEPRKQVEAAKPTDTATVAALVPPALATKLKFERREMRDQFDDTFSVLAPADWKQEEGFATLKPPGEDAWGSSMRISSDCAGSCVEKDWAAVTDKEEFARMREGEVVADTKTPTSRLMIAKTDKVTAVKYAWWEISATRYAVCSASLKEPYRDAAPAFLKACQSAKVTSHD
jgi:hypothetical protein